jgi:AAA+ superfamily predicted ATPase
MCTNRLEALDPAVRRRSAVTVTFTRPNDAQRHAFLSPMLAELSFTDTQVRSIVQTTGTTGGRGYGYTYSDRSQRLLPGSYWPLT